ncbi:hypothetical protein SEA_AEGEUS_86 [Mycobacterium phage Aegeus]|nr:hypothetical protein SEA_BAUDELAIRE_86 [Mycobacterium phage Baudelaire]WKW86578.1 hypothetical protein SEA_AEGEUS_86 [Mycobacterium phage Aegeus]
MAKHDRELLMEKFLHPAYTRGHKQITYYKQAIGKFVRVCHADYYRSLTILG